MKKFRTLVCFKRCLKISSSFLDYLHFLIHESMFPPLPPHPVHLQAVCCEDHLHCCPHGTVCNLAASTCDGSSGGAVTPLLPNTPVFPLQAEDTECDESTSCPGNSTCCQALSGRWACCPLPQVNSPPHPSFRCPILQVWSRVEGGRFGRRGTRFC